MVVNENDIYSALKKLGISSGDCVIVHSSLSSFGYVEGGADAVIDALLKTLWPHGTLVMPTLCQRDKDLRFETWDIAKSPSDVGHVTEVFRRRWDSVRSDHPTHSVAAIGPMAEEITAGHGQASGRPGPWGDAAFAVDSPWQKLCDLNAKIILVGVDFTKNTMVHMVEHLIVERAFNRFPPEKREAKVEALWGWQKHGVWPAYDRLKLQAEMDNRGLISRVNCGSGVITAVCAGPFVEVSLSIMEADPAQWFEKDFCQWYGETGD